MPALLRASSDSAGERLRKTRPISAELMFRARRTTAAGRRAHSFLLRPSSRNMSGLGLKLFRNFHKLRLSWNPLTSGDIRLFEADSGRHELQRDCLCGIPAARCNLQPIFPLRDDLAGAKLKSLIPKRGSVFSPYRRINGAFWKTTRHHVIQIKILLVLVIEPKRTASISLYSTATQAALPTAQPGVLSPASANPKSPAPGGSVGRGAQPLSGLLIRAHQVHTRRPLSKTWIPGALRTPIASVPLCGESSNAAMGPPRRYGLISDYRPTFELYRPQPANFV